jgi:tetratricopeptide (TPR) repeat protein
VLALSIALFFVFARFRFSLVPLLVLFAAYACREVVRCVGSGSFRRPGIAIAAGVLLALALGAPADWAGALPDKELGVAATYNNLGTALARSGRPDAGLASYRRAVEAYPDYAAARFNLGSALTERGALREALPHIERAIELEPEYYADGQVALGVAAARRGDFVEARARLEDARSAAAESAEVHANLGLVLRQMGEFEEAEVAYREALRIRPGFADVHNNLGFLLHGTGREAEAVEHYERALRHDPGHTRALESLAWVRAASPDPALNDADQALELAQRGRRLVGGAGWEDLYAMALAAAGRFDEAQAVAEEAETLAREARQGTLVREIAARRALYMAGRAYIYAAPEDG